LIHDPEKVMFGWLEDEEEGAMISVRGLIERIRESNKKEIRSLKIMQDQCPSVCYKNIKLGETNIDYLQINCSKEFQNSGIDEFRKSIFQTWKPKFGTDVLLSPNEKSLIFSQTTKGEAVSYQFHEVKISSSIPLVVEQTDNLLFEILVLKKDQEEMEEYLYPKAFYPIEKVSFYCQTDAAINGLNCRWCNDWNKCCNGDIEGIKNEKGNITCADASRYGTNNCCYATSSFMVTQFGKSVGTKRIYLVDLFNSDDLRDGVNSIANLTDNNDIRNVIKLIKAKTPIVAGVYYADRYDDEEDTVDPKNHKTDGVTNSPTCHFIVIVGYGINKEGNEYFTFYDPASKENGNSNNNILTIDKTENLIKGKRNNDTKQSYILTEFRLP